MVWQGKVQRTDGSSPRTRLIARLEQYVCERDSSIWWMLACLYEEQGNDLLNRYPVLAEGYYRLALRAYTEMEDHGRCWPAEIAYMREKLTYAGYLHLKQLRRMILYGAIIMKKQEEKAMDFVESYFKDKGVFYECRQGSSFCFTIPFSKKARLRDCLVELFTGTGEEENSILVLATLPIRVKRTEMYDVGKELALINEELPDNAGYYWDPLDCTVRLKYMMTGITAKEQLSELMGDLPKCIEEDMGTILDAIVRAKDTIDKALIAKRMEENSFSTKVMNFFRGQETEDTEAKAE